MSEPHGPTPNQYTQPQFAPMNRPIQPFPGGQYPVPPLPPGLGGPPPGSPGPNRRKMWALLATVAVVAVIGIVLTVTLSGRSRHDTARPAAKTETSATASASSDKSPVPVSKIEELLPRQGALAAAVADPELGVVMSGEAMDEVTVVDADCQGISSVASGPVYAGTGWTAIRWQRWYSPPDIDTHDLKHGLLVSVATFPRAENAQAFYAKQSDKWKRCAGRTLNMTVTSGDNEPRVFWTVTEVTESDELVKTTAISEGGGGWSCQDALTIRNNVVAQADVCGNSIPANAAQDILGSITPKVDAAG
ncbi:sensor domain-containing protein [Mycobacterium sp. SMC-19]|uniref:sensor domain-containing protein n=1 Tax=Mycobacterium sp. SMC-19 TaxID=3381630 RepID=UPI003876DB72